MTISPSTPTIITPGIDTSTWQDSSSTPQHMDFSKAVEKGAKFVYIKASQATWLDDDFLINWKNAKDAGLIRGAYHYMDWSKTGIEQARFFAGLLQKDPGELPPALDYEQRANVPAPVKARTECKLFLYEAEKLLKKKLILYTSPYFWREFGSTEATFAEHMLWIANYTTAAAPVIPLPWKRWTFWQWTDRGDGLAYGAESKGLDMDWFNGSYADLLKISNMSQAPLPSQPQTSPLPAAITIQDIFDMHSGLKQHPGLS